MHDQLIVFLKAPRPGFVKTRLARTVGEARACEIYQELVTTVLDRIASIQRVELLFTPDDAAAEVSAWLRPGWTAQPQGGGNLGARLSRAVVATFARGASRVIIIGTDCPEVLASHVEDALRALSNSDVVLGPAADGGYWLIGMRAPFLTLFDRIPWSTDAVLGETQRRAASTGLTIALLGTLIDIDTEDDWHRWLRYCKPNAC